MTWRAHIVEWIPFACLVTDKFIRKPMVTRIVESVFIAAIGGGVALAGNYVVLKRDADATQAALIAYMKMDSERSADRVLRRDKQFEEVARRLERIENYLLAGNKKR